MFSNGKGVAKKRRTKLATYKRRTLGRRRWKLKGRMRRKGRGGTPQRRANLSMGSGEGSSGAVLTLFSLLAPCRGAATISK